ncbi:S1C family serine protease [Streptomyces sp. CB02400]|uniref:S1C family serine protease n=1 Tax=Streptomyces sp. CB02400 TaxID=1703944 RepID=UPI001F23A367|nr:trypsin-like peptidase domain-containing protein [Streptomyces sp. CB02400]
MNEGKPGPPGEEPTTRPEGHDGDFELARPHREPAAAGDDHEGDYELDRPLRPEGSEGRPPEPAPEAPEPVASESVAPDTPVPAPGASAAGPVVPDEPVGETSSAAPARGASGTSVGSASPAVPAPGASLAETDTSVGSSFSAVPARGASGTSVGSASPAVPAPGASLAETDTSVDSPSSAVPAPAVSDPPPVAFEPSAPGQQTPLHDPDPYSTPPYGEPGPWAPAPPVQHPATTPAHGMALAAPPPPPDTTPHTGPVPQGAPPAPPSGLGTAPHGTPAPQGTSAPQDAPPASPSGLDTAPYGTPAPHAAPTMTDMAPHGAPTAPVIPAQAHPDAQVPPAQDTPAADPWGRYDPWAAAAAAAPLQQAGPTVVSEKQKRRRARRVLIGAALLLALVSGGVGGIIGTYLERNGGVGTVELPQAGKEASGRDPGSVAGIAAQALPSVVTLHVSGAGEAGTGTGFVLDGRGHILTNDHVVEPAGDDGEITVTFHSGDTAEATVVGRDSGYDLAVVKVKGVSGLTPLPLGNSDNVRVGDPVVAIGAPFDLAGTVTSGIISARERPITAGGEEGDGSDVSYVDALQTDAPINPGNSGGPLLDAKARVIGINSAIRSAGGGADPDAGQAGSIGLGFAIPINQGKRVAEELINTGKATHPVIGITLDMQYGGDGARVAEKGSDGGPPVSTGGPGARAGIKAGDVITEVDGRRVHSGEELIVKTRAHRPGDRLELTLERDGEERTVTLTLGSSEGD